MPPEGDSCTRGGNANTADAADRTRSAAERRDAPVGDRRQPEGKRAPRRPRQPRPEIAVALGERKQPYEDPEPVRMQEPDAAPARDGLALDHDCVRRRVGRAAPDGRAPI